MFTPANLIGSMLFGLIGFAAFVYSKKTSSIKALLIGVALMVYPYFVPQTWLLYTVGCVLTAALFILGEG